MPYRGWIAVSTSRRLPEVMSNITGSDPTIEMQRASKPHAKNLITSETNEMSVGLPVVKNLITQ